MTDAELDALCKRLQYPHDVDCELNDDPDTNPNAECTCTWVDRTDAADAIAALREQVAEQSKAADMIAEERDAWEKRAKSLEADNAALREQITRLQLEVTHRNARAIEGDRYKSAFDAEFYRAERAEADNAALRQIIESAHKVMHGDGVMDQGQAWDACVRLLDTAMREGKG